MYMRFKDNKSKVLTLSYDDGVVQDIRLMDIMNKHGLKGTFNLNSGLYMPEDQEREKFYGKLKRSEALNLYKDSGHEVAVHGFKHQFLHRLESVDVINEILEDRKAIERDYGTIARGMAYSYGTYNDEVIRLLKNCGICYSRTVDSTEWFLMPQNWLALNPTCHHNNPKLMELADRFVSTNLNEKYYLWMFYLWGHSYEFDNDNNWEVIEKFAQLVGGRDDIWYATNIEIYDYVQAYKNLQTSVDKRIIHNPSDIDVWVYDEKETFVIPASGTIYRDK